MGKRVLRTELNYWISDMTLVKPYLFLNRLVIITHDGTVAYDQKFHHKTNIVRGNNSSGKSTIANFIFYALGGDYNNWTTEAQKCREVFAEIEVNQATLTLKRSIKEHLQQPMGIFWGAYEEAISSNFEGWKYFPYRVTTYKESFSNVLFSALDFPEVRSSDDSKITINQILRLLYIDQDSPTQNLFRFETFDLPITRQAISELLLGVYDDSLYQDRLSIREAEQNYHQKKDQFDSISKIFTSTGNEPDIAKIVKEISTVRSKIDVEQGEIENLRAKAYIPLKSNSPLKIEKLHSQQNSIKAQINSIATTVQDIEFDIVDSEQFVEMLEKRIVALDTSIATRNALGELPLEYCPQCLKSLGEHQQSNTCTLCKQPLDNDVEKTQSKRLRQEIALQVKESKKLLEEKRKRLNSLSTEFSTLLAQFRSKQREIDLEAKEHNSTRDDKLDELLVSRGRLEGQLESLNKQIEFAKQLEVLKDELQVLQKQIEELRQSVKLKEDKQRVNLQKALRKIEEIALLILREDLDRQEEFKTANEVSVNFLKDSFALDGGNNFSASSNTYLKNAVRFAIFFASLELPYFRYPRFIICDNMEDKGMEKERTQNFQKVITKLSETYDIDHQIIFTTSMIETALDNSGHCVGEFYTKANKTLKFSPAPTLPS